MHEWTTGVCVASTQVLKGVHGHGAEKNTPGRTGEADSYRALAPGPRCTPITPNDQLSRSLLPSPRNKWKTQHTGNRHTLNPTGVGREV
jgi:hypothetical protein